MQHLMNSDEASPESHVVTRYDSATAIQTDDWKLITDGMQHRLYSKPDDRWEVNNVANRCQAELEELQKLLSD